MIETVSRFLIICVQWHHCISTNGCLSQPADFTSDSAFHLDDVGGAGEAKASQNSLPALQLVHLQDGSGFLQLSLGGSNICPNLKHTHTKKQKQKRTHVLLYNAAFSKRDLGVAFLKKKLYWKHFDNYQLFCA